MLKTADFDYFVPPKLIAHQPAEQRDHSRLMVLNRQAQSIEHKYFYDIIDYLQPGDLLVLNNTKVIPANLMGKKEEGGAKIEVLLLNCKQKSDSCRQTWECLVKPGKKLKIRSRVIFGNDEVIGTVLEKTESGEQLIEFEGNLEEYMRKNGEIPLPPYIKKADSCQQKAESCRRYQTVYAENEGASAAPTAGLHFTPQLLEQAENKGIEVAFVTLHTGLATFKPVYAENVEDHRMYFESYEVQPETIEKIRRAKRIVAVGTTSVRTLESIAEAINNPKPVLISGETNLFVYPGYKFKLVDAMITNFHWPKTSLIMLVSAFASREFIMKAYQEAIDQHYRFFSFGDAMLIV